MGLEMKVRIYFGGWANTGLQPEPGIRPNILSCCFCLTLEIGVIDKMQILVSIIYIVAFGMEYLYVGYSM
jgi:hypothetical protein